MISAFNIPDTITATRDTPEPGTVSAQPNPGYLVKKMHPGNVVKAASNHARAAVHDATAQHIVTSRRLELRANGALQKS